jgi:hypothetical protein
MQKIHRPFPPELLFEREDAFAPDQACEAWIRATFIEPAGPLYSEEHDHLRSALLGVMWTTVENSRHMQPIAAQAEKPFFQGNRWSKARQTGQFVSWFGEMPDFLLTFDARYARQCSDIAWCALVEHELLHCGQAKDEFGGPKFNKQTGMPVFAIRGHDVSEEFVTVVRRYGAGAAAGKTAELVEAARHAPEIGAADIARVCGTCR